MIVKNKEPEWLTTNRVLQDYSSRDEYAEFVTSYESKKELLSRIKHEIANW
jgi:hypothetical protein